MIVLRKDLLNLVKPDDDSMTKPPAKYDFEKDGDSAENVSKVLFEKMKELNGVGLSANQLGLDMSVFVIGTDYSRMFVFNPEILEYIGEKISFKEGCLSYPGIFLDIKRPKTIKAKWQNEKGEWQEQILDGVSSRIFQHEYDHMQGLDFTHYASKLKLDMAKKKYNNKKRKIIRKHAIDTMIKALKEKPNEHV